MRVKAPSSTANLGPGFDIFGLALDAYYDEVEVSIIDHDIIIESYDNIPLAIKSNSAGLAATKLLNDFKISDGLKIKIKKGIPTGYGLGSSAASAAAVIKALDKLYGLDLTNEELVRYAAIGEQASAGSIHYDNVAASMLGGFIIVRSEPFRVVRIEPPEMRFCIAIPKIDVPNMKTQVARSVIPNDIPLKSMVYNLSNASMIVAGFSMKDIRLITESIRDAIIEPARARLIKGYEKVKKNALEAGALAVTISGAGPSLIAFLDGSEEAVRRAMLDGFKEEGIDAHTILCNIDRKGTSII